MQNFRISQFSFPVTYNLAHPFFIFVSRSTQYIPKGINEKTMKNYKNQRSRILFLFTRQIQQIKHDGAVCNVCDHRNGRPYFLILLPWYPNYTHIGNWIHILNYRQKTKIKC